MVKRISTGSPFEATFGYSRAVVDGDRVHVSGTTGYDYATMTMPESVGEQAANALKTIEKALNQAGADIKDVVRVTYYVGDRSYVDEVVKAVGPVFSDIRPAATMLLVGMIEEAMKIEIEVDAPDRRAPELMVVYAEKLDPTSADVAAVLSALEQSEKLAGRDAGYQPFSVLLRDSEDGPVIGGLYGYQLFDWMFIQYVAVPPGKQGQGIGQELMARPRPGPAAATSPGSGSTLSPSRPARSTKSSAFRSSAPSRTTRAARNVSSCRSGSSRPTTRSSWHRNSFFSPATASAPKSWPRWKS